MSCWSWTAVLQKTLSAVCRPAQREKYALQRSCKDAGGVETILTAIPAACGKQRPSAPQSENSHQFEENMEALCRNIENGLAENSRKNYLGQWQLFAGWALNMGFPALPADPAQVAAYISERSEKHGHRPATLHTAVAAIAYVHRASWLGNPCDNPGVKNALKNATRRTGKLQRQAEALTVEMLAKIRATACKPRRGRGGNLESGRAAKSRGKADIAMISLMRDAMLRVSEATAVKWEGYRSPARRHRAANDQAFQDGPGGGRRDRLPFLRHDGIAQRHAQRRDGF